jgi:hypothetical protein
MPAQEVAVAVQDMVQAAQPIHVVLLVDGLDRRVALAVSLLGVMLGYPVTSTQQQVVMGET